ncbi:unnamed protein product [Clonostachys chloroleuca]|uniref:Uncharacterized protein n=1 Tax=Clonostachys chloroleuca TaxID=1926264 RepID=A0AA35LVG9_9HYPO|nr:unnamed protein product [Clonostachys chloroleuca]
MPKESLVIGSVLHHILPFGLFRTGSAVGFWILLCTSSGLLRMSQVGLPGVMCDRGDGDRRRVEVILRESTDL